MLVQRKIEDYTKTIYLLGREGTVRGIDIARALNVKQPTVSMALQALESEGYLLRMENRTVVLTAKGIAVARETLDRYVEIYRLLRCLGISEPIARKDACNLEHILSRESFLALISLGKEVESCRTYEFTNERTLSVKL